MLFVFLCPGTPEGSTGSGSKVLKRLRRRNNGLKSHPTDWEKPGIEPAIPGLQDIGLSTTPWRLHRSNLMSKLVFIPMLFKKTGQNSSLCVSTSSSLAQCYTTASTQEDPSLHN